MNPQTAGSDLPGFEEVRAPPAGELALAPSEAVRQATFTLWYGDQYAGTAIAVGARLVITAGHHFMTTTGDAGMLSLRSSVVKTKKPRAGVGIAFAQKSVQYDVLLLWPEEDLPFVPIYALTPDVGLRVVTAYASPIAPHEDLVVSPGTVRDVSPRLCRSLGTVTTAGASGAPVLDSYGERIVGMHLSVSDSAPDGTWMSEFVPAATIVELLAQADADPAVPYRAEVVEEEERQRKEAAAAARAAKKQAAKSAGRR